LLSVRGGGHGFAGFGTNDDGVVIDLGNLANVEITDQERHLVRIGGGATWGQVAAALAPYGLAISSGDTKSVGVGGLTLTGGIGWKVRKYGLALDNVVAAEVVTANAEVVQANAQANPELFWAIRGGGSNFGIVTAFEFVAHPTTDVFFGKIAFPATEAAAVLQGWADYLRIAPEELTSVVDFANPFAGGPEAPVEIYVAFDGDDPELAAQAIDPIRRLGTVTGDDVALKPYVDTLADGATPPPGIQFAVRSAFVDQESVPEVLQILAEVRASEWSPFIAVRSVGGAVSRIPDDATAYAHRQAELMFVTTAAGPKPVVEAARPAQDAIWGRLAPHVNGAYANFLSSATEEDVAAIYPTQIYQRLAAVKRQYDPGNLFACNHNVRPLQALADKQDGGPRPGHQADVPTAGRLHPGR
jgi:FAD/FMN-containing dehydrogenase